MEYKTITDSGLAKTYALHGERSEQFQSLLAKEGYKSFASGLFAQTYQQDGDLHECPDPAREGYIVTIFCFR